ncbi:MAG: NADH-quinone oxidoreductase subunit NuoK [Pirellulales bacterium]
MVESELALLHNYLLVGAVIFSIGLVGFLARRNMIVMFLSAEMMLQGVSLSLVAWSRFHNDWGGQVLVIMIIVVAACEAAIALALVLMLFRRAGKLDVAVWQELREANQAAYVDHEVPEEVEPDTQKWPRLTPAGVEPDVDEEEMLHRPHV